MSNEQRVISRLILIRIVARCSLLIALVCGLPLAVPAVAQQPPDVPGVDLTLEDLGLRDQVVRGVFGQLSLTFPGPGDATLVDGSYLALVYSQADILLPDQSSLSVLLNGAPVADRFLLRESGSRVTWRVPLPTDKLSAESNTIQLNFYLRAPNTSCQDFDNPGLLATVYASTRLHLALAPDLPTSYRPDLARFPRPFWAPVAGPSGGQPQATLVLPAAPSPSEYSAAALLSLKFGQLAGSPGTLGVARKPNRPAVQSYLADRTPLDAQSERNLVLIGRPGGHALIRGLTDEASGSAPIRWRREATGDLFLSPNGTPLPRDQGVIEIVRAPTNPRHQYLLVTGATDEAVSRAAQTLSGGTFLKALSGEYALINERPQVGSPELTPPGGAREFSLEQIGKPDQSVMGWGDQVIPLPFQAPPPDPKGQSYVDLVFSHSRLSSPSRSVLTATLNDTPLIGLPLREDNASRARVRVPLPAQTLKPGQNTLELHFNQQPERDDCTRLQREQSWGVLHNETTLHLARTTDLGRSDLGVYPFPYLEEGSWQNTRLVLPGRLEDRLAVLDLLFDLGRVTGADPVDLQTVPDDAVSQELRARSHLIAVGPFTGNRLIGELGDKLPLRLDQQANRSLQQGDRLIVGLRDDSRLGIIETLPSPWARNRAVLVVSGTVPEALSWAQQGLRGALGALAGNVITVTSEGRTSSFNVPGSPEQRAQEQTVRPPEPQNNSGPLLIAVLVAVGLVFGLLIVLAVLAVRRRAR